MTLTVLLGGDVYVTGRPQPAAALAGLAEPFDAADLRILNAEGLAVSTSGRDGVDIPHKANWRHPGTNQVEALRGARVDAVSCANNVTYPRDKIVESLAALDAAGIGHAGAGANDADARKPCVLEHQGTRVALLAYSSIVFPYGHAAGEDTPGIAPLRAHTAYVPDPRSAEVPGRPPTVFTTPDARDLKNMTRDVQAARSDADIVILSMHWGFAGTEISGYQTEIAQAAIDAGADVVFGHGPHSMHGIELYQGRPILYSLGNLAFDWEPMRDRHRDGILAICQYDSGEIKELEIQAAHRDAENQVRLAAGEERTRILSNIADLSPSVAKQLTETSNGMALRFATPD